jgi:hypothetical protein
MRLYMSLRQSETARVAAAKAGFSAASAYRIERDPRLPSQKQAPRSRRRPDLLAAVWESEIVPMLAGAPGLRAVAIFEEMRQRHPEIGAGDRGQARDDDDLAGGRMEGVDLPEPAHRGACRVRVCGWRQGPASAPFARKCGRRVSAGEGDLHVGGRSRHRRRSDERILSQSNSRLVKSRL